MRVTLPIILAVCATLVAGPSPADPVVGATDAVAEIRKNHGRRTLVHSEKLQAAAEFHAEDMLRNNFFSHKGTRGSTMSRRIKRAGFRACFAAENIAKGQRSLESVLGSWMNSPGHRRNLLARDAVEFGLARTDGNIWVLVLGRRC